MPRRHGDDGDPIVMAPGAIPSNSLISQLSRPGGNITGVSLANSLLPQYNSRSTCPRDGSLRRASSGALVNPTDPNRSQISIREMRKQSGCAWRNQLSVVQAEAIGDFEAVFATLVQNRVGAAAALTSMRSSPTRQHQLVDFALQHASACALPEAGTPRRAA